MRRPTLVLALALLAFAARPAHAYIDPASGSMMLQIVLGGLAGAAVGLKLFWRRVRGRFGRRAAGIEPGPGDPERPGGV